MAAGWAHWWPLVATLHSQVWRWEKWGTLGRQVGRWGEFGVSGFLGRLNGPAFVQALSAVHMHTPCHPRPTPRPSPCPPLAYLLCTQVRGCPNPLVSLAVQPAIGHSRAPGAPSRSSRAPQGGYWSPAGYALATHIFGPKKSPQVHHRSPQVHHRSPQVHPPSPHLFSTTHTWLIKVNRGCAKVSIGCLAVGLYVPASAVQKNHRGL